MAKKKKRTGPKRALSAYNRHVQREMKAGRSMKQAAASWKSGRRSSTGTPKRSTSRRTSIRRTAKKKVRKVGKSGFNTQKIFKYVRLAALAMPAAGTLMQPTSTQEKLKGISLDYFGINPDDGSFKLERLAKGWMPFLAANVVTHGIPKVTGILRSL